MLLGVVTTSVLCKCAFLCMWSDKRGHLALLPAKGSQGHCDWPAAGQRHPGAEEGSRCTIELPERQGEAHKKAFPQEHLME